MNIFQKITNSKNNFILYEEGILTAGGRLTNEGHDLVVDLLFQGKNIEEIKSLIIKEIEEEKLNKNK